MLSETNTKDFAGDSDLARKPTYIRGNGLDALKRLNVFGATIGLLFHVIYAIPSNAFAFSSVRSLALLERQVEVLLRRVSK